ncbi:hypothetical protein H0H92_003448 [Tricholoma furcatifolium]|nr:hypothetical protein H0H92_003448 [Tricholoma furcatifolium]
MLWVRLIPLLVVLSVVHADFSPNDPFRILALDVPKKPEWPVCCLKPQQPLEDEILLSFEEWKQQQQGTVINHTEDHNASDLSDQVHANDTVIAHYTDEPQKPPPHFRVPITDRFNYASSECSARVHLAHRGAKSTSAILSSKRDRYMLSPCNTQNQFVIVELCEDIRIDTVQLANFEFFSGIFKDFKISVAKTDITTEGAFTEVGIFRARNVRGVQSFHPPPSLRDFYRYIRIDFLSHYGNEYYCPVSLLRVYGLTHLEEWKWDLWEQESREKTETPKIESTSTTQEPSSLKPSAHSIPSPISSTSQINVVELPVITSLSLDSILDTLVPTVIVSDTSSEPYTVTETSVPTATDASTTIQQQQNTSTATPVPSQMTSTSDVTSSVSGSPSAASPSVSISTSTAIPKTSPSANTSPSSGPASTATPQHPPPPSQQNGPTSGESIYRTIMNRLTALEANHTLYARYVEQQTSGVREVLRRLSEDAGRLEVLVRAQERRNGRIEQLERDQGQVERELGELRARVEILTEEIGMEKKLGVAQLCLLLVVLVFMGLTRGSRGDVVVSRGRKESVREWGRKHLSFSGEWRFGTRGRKEERAMKVNDAVEDANEDGKIQFPSKDSEPVVVESPRPRVARPAPVLRSVSSDSGSGLALVQRSRSRTPSLRMRTYQHQQHVQHHPSSHLHTQPHTAHLHQHQRQHQHITHLHRQNHNAPGSGYGTPPRHQRPASVSVPLPAPLLRSSSHTNTPHNGHRSARKWARTAHLHEVRMRSGGGEQRRPEDGEEEDPFLDRAQRGKEKRESDDRQVEVVGLLDDNGDGDGDGDVWVDTDPDSDLDEVVDVGLGVEDGKVGGDWTRTQRSSASKTKSRNGSVSELRRPPVGGNVH